MKKYFITGTGTDIGKTLVTAGLVHQLVSKGVKVKVAKPVISGWNEAGGNDTEILLAASGQSINQKNIHSCSPWRFRAPLSPNLAARREGREINFDEVVKFCNNLSAERDEVAIIEGAGGIMSPISDEKTNLDLIIRTKASVILVAGNYLGSISHTLTALMALQAKHISDVQIIISESVNFANSLEENMKSIQRFCNISVKTIPRLRPSENNWKNLPDLTHLIPKLHAAA